MKILVFSQSHLNRLTDDFVKAGYPETTGLKLNQLNIANLLNVDMDLLVVFLESENQAKLNRLNEIRAMRSVPAVLFCDSQHAPFIEQAMASDADSVVVNGYSAMRIKYIIEIAVQRFNQFDRMRRDLQKAKSKLSELQLINKAKSCLMRDRGVGELEAGNIMRNMAAHRRKRLVEVAKDIISLSGVLTRPPGAGFHPSLSRSIALGGELPD